jgi:plastocyanin
MQNTAFSPASKTITAGTTLTWTNMDPFNHTVTSGAPGSPDGKFDSGNIGSNGTYSHKFDTAGTYNYYCKIHGSAMTGTVIVQ